MEFLWNTIKDAIPLVVSTIVEHAAYPFQVDNKIRDLVSATRNLAAMKEDAKTRIINAEREDGTPTKQIEEWLNRVEVIEKEAEEIPENYRKRRRSVWSDYMAGRNAVKKLREVKSLCDQKTNIEVSMHVPPPLSQELPESSLKSANLDLALEHIKDDVNGVIGIYGMGGVGKTHLLKQINNKLLKDSSINLVMFITCSKECSEEKIQDEIIGKLGFKKSISMEQKQITLFNFFKKRSFALLLDDLWSRMDLEIVGIPVQADITGTCKRKIILTTRSTDVCGLMEVQKLIKVDVLNWDRSWNLFTEKATTETIVANPLIHSYAVEIVKELGGLPLALITIGRAMHDKRDPGEWELAVELLKKARLNDVELSGTDETVFKILKFSYDKLQSDNLRECFLHCSLWPEDNEIEKNELVELWMGLGLIDEPSVSMAYRVGYGYISRLQAVCLLETTDKESRIKLHDVIRDMSLWIVSNQGITKNRWIVGSSTLSEIVIQRETEKISLMDHKGGISFSTTSYDSKLNTFLFLPSFLTDIKVLPLQSLSNLTILNLRGNRFEVFPLEICSLRSLCFIDLSESQIKSLPNELGELTHLKYLLLRGNIIRTFPVSAISKMKSLHVLDLTRRTGIYKKIYQIKLDFVASLLEELQHLAEFGAVGIEINDMIQFQKLIESPGVTVRWLTITIWEELSTFSISCWFLGTSQSRRNLISLRITNMVVKQVIFESTCRKACQCQLGRLEELHMFHVQMQEIVWKGLDPKDIFPRLKHVMIHSCDYVTNISWVRHLPCLRELKIIRCPAMKQLIHSDIDEQSEPIFPFLKLVELKHLIAFESMCAPDITFRALESLTIYGCRKMKNLPFGANNIPRSLNCIRVDEKWWNDIKWDESLKASLSGFVRFVI